jgi:2-methylcitrate dehydratase PrpD
MLTRQQFLSGLGASGAVLTVRPAAAQGPRAEVGVTAEIADFVAGARWSSLPPELIELSKKHILDCCGLALAGERAESGPIVRRYLATLGAGQGGAATVLGTGLRAAPRFTAFANGVAIHADDYDDTQLAVAKDRVYGLLTHPSVTALPAALAMAEASGRSGRDFMLAYHLGVEVETKLAEASNPRAYETGFHSTGLFGVFGAAVAAAKVRGLDAKSVRNALGIAGGEASGLRENFGTMTKPFQAGHAAEGGVAAADLAALGWTAAENIIEAQRGLFAATAGGFDSKAISGKLGKPWSFLTPGISIKPYPSGSLTHPAMDEMSRLVRTNNLKPQDVAAIRVGANKQMLNTLIHPQPTTGLEAKFSMQYCMAVLVTDGKAGLGQFTDAAVNKPGVQALLRRVDFYNNPAADAAGADKMRSFIEIRLKDGRVINGAVVDYARGSPQIPMSFEDEKEKFRDCAGYGGLSAGVTEQIIARIQTLDRVDDIRTLTSLLAFSRRSARSKPRAQRG